MSCCTTSRVRKHTKPWAMKKPSASSFMPNGSPDSNRRHVRFGSLADIGSRFGNVRFAPRAFEETADGPQGARTRECKHEPWARRAIAPPFIHSRPKTRHQCGSHGRRWAVNHGPIVLLAPFGPRATHIVQLGAVVVEQRLG